MDIGGKTPRCTQSPNPRGWSPVSDHLDTHSIYALRVNGRQIPETTPPLPTPIARNDALPHTRGLVESDANVHDAMPARWTISSNIPEGGTVQLLRKPLTQSTLVVQRVQIKNPQTATEAAILTSSLSIFHADPEPVGDAAAAPYRASSTITRSRQTSLTNTSESTPEIFETGDSSNNQMHGKRSFAPRPSKRRRKGLSTSNCVSDDVSVRLPSDLAALRDNYLEDTRDVNTDEQVSAPNSSVDVGHLVLRGIFCDYCGDGGDLVTCSASGCLVTVCVSKDATKCITWDASKDAPWFCVQHNMRQAQFIKYTINSRSKSYIRNSRVLRPFLVVHLYPCEKLMDKRTLTVPNVEGRLRDFYKHSDDAMFLCIQTYANSGLSLNNLRRQAKSWMSQYPMSMVLILIEGHTAIQTGELVYALPGCKHNLYTQPAEFLKAILLDCYDTILIGNRGRRGLIAISCGYTFHHPGSRQSWTELIDRNHLDWIVGFSAKILMPSRVTEALPTFIELAFLREQADVADAIHRAFNRQELLTHTGVLLCRKTPSADGIVLEEFVRSNQDRPWGLELPDCPSCHTRMFMRANQMEDGKHCRLRCGRCHSYSKMSVPRPAFVVPRVASYLDLYRYFTIPFPSPADVWSHLDWVEKVFISE